LYTSIPKLKISRKDFLQEDNFNTIVQSTPVNNVNKKQSKIIRFKPSSTQTLLKHDPSQQKNILSTMEKTMSKLSTFHTIHTDQNRKIKNGTGGDETPAESNNSLNYRSIGVGINKKLSNFSTLSRPISKSKILIKPLQIKNLKQNTLSGTYISQPSTPTKKLSTNRSKTAIDSQTISTLREEGNQSQKHTKRKFSSTKEKNKLSNILSIKALISDIKQEEENEETDKKRRDQKSRSKTQSKSTNLPAVSNQLKEKASPSRSKIRETEESVEDLQENYFASGNKRNRKRRQIGTIKSQRSQGTLNSQTDNLSPQTPLRSPQRPKKKKGLVWRIKRNAYAFTSDLFKYDKIANENGIINQNSNQTSNRKMSRRKAVDLGSELELLSQKMMINNLEAPAVLNKKHSEGKPSIKSGQALNNMVIRDFMIGEVTDAVGSSK
jgi:hypothetical protein